MGRVRVAYTLEQCWHDAPGGTAVAAIEVARRLAPRDDVTLRRRGRPPPSPRRRRRGARRSRSPSSGLPRPLLYEAWLRLRPAPRRAGHRPGRRGPRHRPRAVPVRAPRSSSRCTTWRSSTTPSRFSRQGLRVMRRSLDVTRDTRRRWSSRRARPAARDLEASGVDGGRHPRRPARRRPRPGRRRRRSPGSAERHAPARALRPVRRHARAAQEPRAGSARRWPGSTDPLPLVVAGPDGWGDADRRDGRRRALPRLRAAPPTCRRCTPRRRCSPTRASRRASACPSPRRWPRARRSSRAPARRPRRSPAGPPCSSTRSTSTPSPPASTRPSAAPASCPPPGGRRAAELTWDAAAERDARRLPRRARREVTAMTDAADLTVGVNLLWCLPGAVGGSEEYLVRQLTGLRDAAPEIRARLFVLPGLRRRPPRADRPPRARRRLARRPPAQPPDRRRGDVAAAPARRRRRRPPRRRHGAAALAAARSC